MPRKNVLTDEDAVIERVKDGMTIGIGGFNTAGHPMPIVRGIIRAKIKGLRVVGGTIAGLELDMLIGAGCVDEVVTSAVTAESLVSAGPFFRDACEKGAVRVWECDEGLAYAGLRAAAQGLPSLPWKAGIGTSLPDLNPALKEYDDPISGERLLAVPAIEPDITFLHVERADRFGLGQHTGSGYGDRLLYRAARSVVLTTERVVPNEEIRQNVYATSVPFADAVVAAPWGAHPFSSPGNYTVDDRHLEEYLAVANQARKGDRTGWLAYLDEFVTGPTSHVDYLERVGLRRLVELAY